MIPVRTKLVASVVRAIEISLLTLLSALPSIASAQFSPSDENVREGYYRLVANIVKASPDSQIAALQKFLQDHPHFERSYLKLLERYQVYHRLSDANEHFQKLTLNHSYRRNSLWMLAKIAMMEGDTMPAFTNFSQALRAASPSPALLKDYLDFLDYKKTPGAAILPALKTIPENRQVAIALYYYRKREYEQALKSFLQIPRAVSHDTLVLHVWGDSFRRKGRAKQADSLWGIGFAMARQNGDREALSFFQTNLGILAYGARKYGQALSHYDSAYVVAKRFDDLYNQQRVLGFLGNLNYALSKYNEAEIKLRQATALAITIGEYSYAANWLISRGQLLYELGRFNEALQAYQDGETFADRVNDEALLLDIKSRQARVYIDLSLHEVTKGILREVRGLAMKQNKIEPALRAEGTLAEILVKEKQFDEAIKIYKRFLNFLEKKNNRLERHNYIAKIADIYKTQGQLAEKKGLANEAEKFYIKAKALYQQAGNIAKEIGSTAFEAWYMLDLADIEIALGNLPAAIQQLNDVLEIALAEEIPDLLGHVYIKLGDAYGKTRDLNKAIAAYSRAASIIETTRTALSVDALRIGYFSEKSRVYRKLAEAFFQRHEVSTGRADLDSLFYYAQMTQGRALHDLRLRTSTGTNDTLYQRACTQLQLIQRALRAEPNKYDSLRASLEAARYSLIAQRLRLAKQYGDSTQKMAALAQPLAKMQTALKRFDLGLLLYRISDETSYVMVVTGLGAKTVRLQTSLSALAAMVDSLIVPFHEVKEDSVRFTPYRAGLAHRLYEVLIKPVEQTVGLPERLLIVPDLALMNLPFEMLLTSPPEKSQYLPDETSAYANDFLLHRYTIVYSPMASLLLEETPKAAIDPDILIFANPFREIKTPVLNQSRLPSDWRFVPLPFSQQEAAKIRALYPRTRSYIREDASEDRFKREARKHRIVHIASHAFVDFSFDAFSELVLAAGQDSTDDGLLMGYEISDLQLSCDLIALSACKTGAGKLVDGEGVLGLPRLFLGAGAKSVLMTQWQVYDQFAAALMPKFYEEFLTAHRSKAEALARAKRALVNDKTDYNGVYYQHPFYWATFVLYGDLGMNHGLSTLATIALIIGALLFLALLFAGIYYLRFKRLPRMRQLVPSRNWH